ncbi:MAG TPA: penicillin-binding protein activator [Usitatibacter sp.]|nr:penicillin-binding protein activator [Usitatibacter sp.]
MSRFKASLLFAFAVMASPAFSADPPPGTTPQDDIDPATGLARTTVVRPLGDAPPVPEPRRAAPAGALDAPKRPHIALILPTASPSLGKLADALRQGFMAAAEVSAKESPPVHVTATDNEAAALLDACRHAQASGALIVVGGLTRDGAHSLAASDCPRQPVLTLNEPRGDILPTVYSVSLSLEQEARQAALLAVADGMRSAIIIHTPSPLSRRVEEAFAREWTRAAGQVRRLLYTGTPDEPGLMRERIATLSADMVFIALDATEALAVRPYITAMLPVYATSFSVNPRTEAIVNADLQGVRYGEMPWFAQPDHPAVMVYPQPRAPMPVEQERLYALGIDAFRLALLLVKAGEARPPPLDGVTGRITLETGNHFTRTLVPAEIDGGRIIPLRTAP